MVFSLSLQPAAGFHFNPQNLATLIIEERGRTMGIYSFVGFLMAFLAPLAVGGVLDLAGNGIVGWGLAFAALALVQMTGPVWLRTFRAKKDA